MPRLFFKSILCLASILFLLPSLPVPGLADEFRLVPSAGLKGEYNDNIFFTPQNEESDFRATFIPALDLVEKTERLDARLRAALPLIHYADNDELDAVDQHYSGALGYALNPLFRGSIDARYDRDSQPDRDILETGLVVGDVTRKRHNYRVAGEYSVSETASAGVGFGYGREDYDDPGFTDIEFYGGDVTFLKDLSRDIANTTARLQFGFNRYDFTGSRVDNFSGMIGAVRRLSEVYSVSADFGLRYTKSEFEVLRLQLLPPATVAVVRTEEKSDDLGVAGRASISYQGELKSASLSFFRDIATSAGRTGTVERTSVVFDVGRRFAYELWFHLAAGYYLNESDQTEFSIRRIDETTWRIGPRVRYDFTSNLRFEASYSYTAVKDHVDGSDADRNLVFVLLTYEHPILE